MEELQFDINGIRTILLRLYESKPRFPISDKKTIIAALGGKDIPIKINKKSEQVPVETLVEKAFTRSKEFKESNEIIDAIIGSSFVDLIAKTSILQIISNLNYPIEDDIQLEKGLASLKIYGLSPTELTDNMTFPIRDASEIIKQLRAKESKLFKVDLRLLDGLDELETFIPTTITKVSKKVKKLEYYQCYIIEEPKPKYCFEVFEEALSRGLNGLCITRMHPKQIKNNYTSIAKGSQVLWLTDRESVKEYPTVSPMISNVNSTVEDFIDNNQRAVLLLDGLEYLISVNSFNPVLFFIEGIKDKIAENEVSLLFSVSPMTFDQKQLKTLERVMEIVADGEKLQIELAPRESAMTEVPEEQADAKPETKVKDVSNVIADKTAEDEQVGEGMIDGELESELAPKLSSKGKLELETAAISASDLPSTEPTEDEGPVSSATTGIAPDDKTPCRSCEGTGKCIWCDERGNCETCKGTGKGSNDEPCADCNGSGKCRSCEGSGKCRWCKGVG